MVSVLHVVSYYPPDRLGGVGEVAAAVHRGLLARGHRSRVLTTGSSKADPNVMRVASSPTGFPLASARALELARAADVVHLHHGEGIGLLLAMQLARVETPVLLTLHVGVARMADSLRPYSVGGVSLGRETTRALLHRSVIMPVRAAMDRAALALARDVSYISASAARDNTGAAASTAPARIIYNGVQTASSSQPSVTPCDLLFVGTNSSRKRVEVLPLILQAVRRRHPAATLRIVGLSESTNPAIALLAAKLGVTDGIEFAGPLRGEALTAQYRSAKVLLVPSAYEGLPMVILEAFAEGLPCVATNISGHPEVITDAINGFLVPLDDIEAMGERTSRLIADVELRQRMGQEAKNTVATRFSLDRQLDEYVAWYAQHVKTA